MSLEKPVYVISEWSPGQAGKVVAEVDDIELAAEEAVKCYQAQISCDRWQGYVVAWAAGGAAAKYFPGHNEYGFYGQIPADANHLVDLIEDLSEAMEEI